MLRINFVPLVFILLFLVSWHLSGMSITFVINEVITRFIRDGILVLALLVPIAAGMGLNFAITIGAICAQVGLLLVIDWQIGDVGGLLGATLMALLLSVILGYIIGYGLNKVKGKEMITTIIAGFLGTAIYQLVFLVGYGTIIKPNNSEIILSRGIGIRNMVDLQPFRNILDNLFVIEIANIKVPVFMISLVLFFCFIIFYFMNTRLGQQIKVVGEDMEKAYSLGIDVDRIRIKAVIISTVIACFGQIIYLQNIGMLNVYTAHLNSDIFSAAAILAGGATIKKAKVRHVLMGIFLFHSLFIVSPQAGQNFFGNAALGEYFRSFVAYATIAFALIMNMKQDNKLPANIRLNNKTMKTRT
ncbi:ABC transporter permease [Desulfotomaculum defluvii]